MCLFVIYVFLLSKYVVFLCAFAYRPFFLPLPITFRCVGPSPEVIYLCLKCYYLKEEKAPIHEGTICLSYLSHF